MVKTGLDRLLSQPEALRGRAYGLLAHAASVTSGTGDAPLMPAHLALARAAAISPRALLAPEHGFYGVEQDMVAARECCDPLTGGRVVSLYGDSEASLVPGPEAFAGLDLLIIDLQDVGSRYYTYAATAVWAAEVALAEGCEVWVLDRPNPLGGDLVEGNLPEPGHESFVSAFFTPVRHGLTLGELVLLEARRRGWGERWGAALRIWEMEGWSRSMRWGDTGLPWIAPSPNMPRPATAELYPGLCLVEATVLSEGRGTTRPFHLVGAPGVDAGALLAELAGLDLPGVDFLPAYFRPQFQKHGGEVCAGVEIVLRDRRAVRAYALGLELLAAFRRVAPQAFDWRAEPYEFVIDRPAIDLLTGSPRYREVLEAGGQGLRELIATWGDDEEAFREERREILRYPDQPGRETAE